MNQENNKNQDASTKNYRVFSGVFKKALAAKGWTLKKLSEETGIPIGTLSNYNSGLNAAKGENREKIKKLLGLEDDVFKKDPPQKRIDIENTPKSDERIIVLKLTNLVADWGETMRQQKGYETISTYVAELIRRDYQAEGVEVRMRSQPPPTFNSSSASEGASPVSSRKHRKHT